MCTSTPRQKVGDSGADNLLIVFCLPGEPVVHRLAMYSTPSLMIIVVCTFPVTCSALSSLLTTADFATYVNARDNPVIDTPLSKYRLVF
jgi:hypothetical protein